MRRSQGLRASMPAITALEPCSVKDLPDPWRKELDADLGNRSRAARTVSVVEMFVGRAHPPGVALILATAAIPDRGGGACRADEAASHDASDRNR